MKLLTDTWRQLVQRRLWPVALLLLGALVAVPFVLGKSPEPAPVATAPAAPAGGVKANAASADPIVSMVSGEDTASTRRSLGDRHNPFASSAPKPKAKKTKDSDAQKPEETTTDDAAATGSGGGTAAPTTPTVPAQPTTTVPAGSIQVRWGATDGSELQRKFLQRDAPLPDADAPGLVFMGLKDHGKTAVFMVMEGLKAFGDGTCVPKDTCEQIELQAGDTEFFEAEAEGDVDGTQFELDLVKIYKHATKVPKSDVESSSAGFGTGSGSTSGGATTASLKARRLH